MRRMTRLHITVEGQAEEEFVKESLSPYLAKFNVFADARCVLTSKDKRRTYRGGLVSYEKAKADILTWMREDANPDAIFTTMFDFYALPSTFPNYSGAREKTDPYDRVSALEKAFEDDIKDLRFIPYIQLHEFESLLFSKPEELKIEYFAHDKEIEKMIQMLKDKNGNPELINDNKHSAPSKRIIQLIPEYEHNKVTVGAPVVGLIGIEHLKKTCRHFGDWIARLERLSVEENN